MSKGGGENVQSRLDGNYLVDWNGGFGEIVRLRTKNGVRKMKLVVKELKKLEDGKHVGTIMNVSYREEPFQYTDVFVQPDGVDFEVKLGIPTRLSGETKLGKLLRKFGADLRPGEEVDLESILLKRRVEFMTVNEETENGCYARIVDGSLKPLVEQH